MRNIYCILLFLFICINELSAQMQTAHWYFGQNVGLDFTSGSPVIDANGQVQTWEGSTSISDENGNLLFYTDGQKVYDRTHNTMQNGLYLHGSYTSTSSAIVLPKPDDCNIYYIFTIDLDEGVVAENYIKRGIKYNVVDMTLNGGLGAIVAGQKNIPVPINGIQQGYEKMAAISNFDKTGYWIVTHFHGNFYAFEVTASGVNLNHVVSPSQIYGGGRNIGYLKGSPDGSKLAMGFSFDIDAIDKYLSLYNFDNSTGVVSNEQFLYYPGFSSEYRHHFYGIEFSTNNHLLYTTVIKDPIVGDDDEDNIHEVWQYNLNATSIPDSKYILHSSPKNNQGIYYSGALLRALDGKIYVNNGDHDQTIASSIARIENPDVAYNPIIGEAPIFTPQFFDFGFNPTGIGLPTFLNHYFRIAITVDGLSISEDQSYCTGFLLDFNYCHQGGEIESIHWDFGDGEESTESYPQHYYNDPGTYTITLTLIVDGEEYIRTFEITITGPPNVENAQQEICLNAGESHTFDLEESLGEINPDNQNLTISFHLTQGEAEDYQNPQPTTYTTSSTTTIWVRAEDENGCFVVRELNLIVNEIPTFTFENVEICINSSAELSVETDSENVVNWYDSSTGTTPIFVGNPFTTPSLTMTTSYWVEVESEEGCVSEREEIIVEIVDSITPIFDLELQYCVGNELIDLPNFSENNISGTWNPAQIDTSILGIQTFTFTPDEGQCADEFTLEIEITDSIEPLFDLDSEYCESEEFITLPTQSDNGITGIWTPAQIDTSVVGIQSFTFTPDENQCAESIPFSVEIFETLIAEFDLTQEYCFGTTPQTLENVSDNGITGTWFPTQIDTNTAGTQIYTFTPDGICGEDFILEVTVLDEITPIFNFPTQYCLNSEEIILPTESANNVSGIWFPTTVDTSNLGTQIYTFTPDLECAETITKEITIVEIITPEFDDLIQNYCLNAEPETLPTISDNGINGTWFPSQIDTNIQGITVYKFTPDSNQCSEEYQHTVTVFPHPDMDLEEELLICKGDEFTYSAPDGFDSYLWKNESNQIISNTQEVTFTEEGIYTLTVEINGIPCDLSRNIEVKFSTPPTITEIKTTENSITIYATGGYPLEYSMNEVFWQSSPTFTNLQPGIFNVFVRDAKGCSTTAKQTGILGVANFISPNGDGYNDTWELRGLEVYPNTRLQIFDRYGKIFVDRMIDSSFTWDGKYNNQPLPSGSYWYILILESGEKISGSILIRNW